MTYEDKSKDELERLYYLGELTGDGTAVTVSRELTGRMLAKEPSTGYTLWIDVTSTSPIYIYTAEAPVGSTGASTGFRGIRITLDALGNPLGPVEFNTNFVWTDRAAITWDS